MSTPPSSSPPGWWRSSPSPSSSSPPSPSGWCGCTGSCWCPWGPALPPTTCSILRIVHWPMNKIERCHLWPIILSYKTCYLYYICISFSFCNTEYMGKFKVRYFMKCWHIWLTLQNEFLKCPFGRWNFWQNLTRRYHLQNFHHIFLPSKAF